MTKRYRLDKKLYVQVRYYENLYSITDGRGERIYMGRDEKVARMVLAALNREKPLAGTPKVVYQSRDGRKEKKTRKISKKAKTRQTRKRKNRPRIS
jgi:hypothetical protein